MEPKIVCIGGGTGLPIVLEGLKKYTSDLVAVVTVTDSGRSSGMLRRDLGILPPGDIRNCLIALSESEEVILDLFQYRFDEGELEGHSFGNLFIAALTKMKGSFGKAVEEASEILKTKGKVIPSTLKDVHICAELENGEIVEEENEIVQRHKRILDRPPIKRVFLKPEAKANKEVVEEIKEADLVIVGPGSLYTSVISNLLVDGVAEAIKESKAKKVYICNAMTQACQTHKYNVEDHVKDIEKYLGKGVLDYVVYNTYNPSEEALKKYEEENSFLVELDEEVDSFDIEFIGADIVEDINEKRVLWEKQDWLRHDPDKLGKEIIKLVKEKEKL